MDQGVEAVQPISQNATSLHLMGFTDGELIAELRARKRIKVAQSSAIQTAHDLAWCDHSPEAAKAYAEHVKHQLAMMMGHYLMGPGKAAKLTIKPYRGLGGGEKITRLEVMAVVPAP